MRAITSTSEHATDAVAHAERAARYLIEHARRASGAKLYQGAWDGAFASDAERTMTFFQGDSSALELLARWRIRCVPRRAISGLFAWVRGFPIELRDDVFSAGEVLVLQAAGQRCVSLLPEKVSPAPHVSGLEFLIHDLCHLDKFADPEHYEEQVGFFATLHALTASEAFRALEGALDETFVNDRNRLGSDVNGSAVYLFALLKMKLKMAARRRHARISGAPVRVSGPLDDGERAVFEELESALYDCLGFDDELRGAARATSARRDATNAALLIAAEFRRRGRGADARSVLAVQRDRAPALREDAP